MSNFFASGCASVGDVTPENLRSSGVGVSSYSSSSGVSGGGYSNKNLNKGNPGKERVINWKIPKLTNNLEFVETVLPVGAKQCYQVSMMLYDFKIYNRKSWLDRIY